MCAKNQFWGQIFKNLSPDLEVAHPRYHVIQFSVKTDNSEFFWPKFGEIAQLHAILWF